MNPWDSQSHRIQPVNGIADALYSGESAWGVVHSMSLKRIKSATLKIRGGCEVDANGNKAGKGALIQWEKSATLGVSQDQTLFVWKATDTDLPTKVTDIV